MSSAATPDESAFFIVRIWLERSASGNVRRGYVEHCASRARRYFSDIEQALEFIAVLGAMPGDGAGAPGIDPAHLLSSRED